MTKCFCVAIELVRPRVFYHDRMFLCRDKVWSNRGFLCCDRAILCRDIVGQAWKIFCRDGVILGRERVGQAGVFCRNRIF